MADQPRQTPGPHARDTQVAYILGELRTAVTEMQVDIHALDENVKESVKSLERRLLGNGQPGLVTRVDRLEIQAKRDRARRAETRHGGGRILTGVIVAVVVLALSEVWHRVREPAATREGATPAVVERPSRVSAAVPVWGSATLPPLLVGGPLASLNIKGNN